MCRVSGSLYLSKFTADEQYKFVYQQVSGHIMVDILEYTQCFDDCGMHYNYLPVTGCEHGISNKNTACVLGKVDSMRLPISVKRELRMFVQDCIIRANYERMCV